jgi:hypothetical protein
MARFWAKAIRTSSAVREGWREEAAELKSNFEDRTEA